MRVQDDNCRIHFPIPNTISQAHHTLHTHSNSPQVPKPAFVSRHSLRGSLQCDNNKDATRAGHDGLLTTPENNKENPTTAGREGLRASLQCDTSGDRASSAHTMPSASNARASTEETASAGRLRGRARGVKNRSWQGDPTRYGLRSSTTIDDNV